MKSTVAVGAGIGSLGAFSGNVEASTSREFTTISGAARARLINRIRNDSEVQELAEQLENKNRVVRYENGKYTRIVTESGSTHKIAVLPLTVVEHGSEKKQAVICWDSRSSENAVAYTLATDANDKVTTRELNSGDISVGTDAHTGGGDGGGSGNCQVFNDSYCTNYDLSCIGWILLAMGVGCGTLNPVACLTGAGVSGAIAIGEYTTGDGCNPCDDADHSSTVYCYG